MTTQYLYQWLSSALTYTFGDSGQLCKVHYDSCWCSESAGYWGLMNLIQIIVKSLIYDAPNHNTKMVLVPSCSWFCPIHWSQVLSREWCSWSSTDRQWSNDIWVINNSIAYQCAAYIRGLAVFEFLSDIWTPTCLGVDMSRSGLT